jgi:hypothetical protein
MAVETKKATEVVFALEDLRMDGVLGVWTKFEGMDVVEVPVCWHRLENCLLVFSGFELIAGF